MKRLTCKQIGGVCNTVLEAETPGEMTKVASEHILEQAKRDPAHKESAKEMEAIYNDEERHEQWKKDFQETWDNAPTI
jgi:hypothetical protein